MLRTLAEANSAPVHVRSHFLFNTGDGTAGLKWGSTNVYTEDAAGNAVYDWRLSDGIMDAITTAGAFPFVELGLMPQALSTRPEPYRNSSSMLLDGGSVYPPTDYRKWAGLIGTWADHAQTRYPRVAESWLWELWNEPDIGLLGRHLRRIRAALRLHRSIAPRGHTECCARCAGSRGTRNRLLTEISGALRDGHQRGHGRGRNAPRLSDLSCQGRGGAEWRPRRDEPGQSTPASPSRVQTRGFVSFVRLHANLHHRGRSRWLRRMPVEQLARPRLPHFTRIWRLRDGHDEAQYRARSGRRRSARRGAHLGIHVPWYALFLRLSRARQHGIELPVLGAFRLLGASRAHACR